MLTPKAILQVATFTPNPDGGFGLPTLFWGPPGVAKSALIEGWAARCGLACKVLSPAEHGDGAFGVTPVPYTQAKAKDDKRSDVQRMRIVYPDPEWLDELEDAHGSILFLDETNLPASAHLFGPMMAMIHARRIAGRKMPNTVRVMGAANPVENSAGGLELPLPMANRMAHFSWPMPDKREWNTYLVGKATGQVEQEIDAKAEEARVMKAWPTAYAEAAALVATFTDKTQAKNWYALPKSAGTGAVADLAWPSLRTWMLAAHALAGARVQGLGADADSFVAAIVGESAATEFAAYRKNIDLPNPEALLDGQLSWKHNPARLDVSYAVFATCAALVVGDTDEARMMKRGERLWSLLATATQTDADICYDAVNVLISKNLDRKMVKASTPVMTALFLVTNGTK